MISHFLYLGRGVCDSFETVPNEMYPATPTLINICIHSPEIRLSLLHRTRDVFDVTSMHTTYMCIRVCVYS